MLRYVKQLLTDYKFLSWLLIILQSFCKILRFANYARVKKNPMLSSIAKIISTLEIQPERQRQLVVSIP